MGKKVLIVDDSIIVRQQVAWALMNAGYQVLEAANGKEGLAVVGKTEDVALILCDINMPEMNGLEMLEEMKTKSLMRCPVVMLTSEGHPDLIAKAKGLGAKGWMVKPVGPELLVSAVDKLVAK